MKRYADRMSVDVVFTTGGTGLGPRDVTPEATHEISEKLVPGLSELMRVEGFKKTRRAALSRGISGLRRKTLIINLPGSSRGVKESIEAVLEIIPHAVETIRGAGHQKEGHQ